MVRSTERFVSQLTQETVAMILAGGKGNRLYELTSNRAAPALNFGGKFRIIDFALSNCINSGIRRVGVITQYKSHSLLRHIINGWGSFHRELGEFIELLPASQQYSSNWYLGTADALFQNQRFVRSTQAKYTLILAGDQVYQMDYGPLLAEHVNAGADVTMSCIKIPCKDAAKRLGVLQIDDQQRVVGFHEKPHDPQPISGDSDFCLGSTGIYVFNTDFLIEQLTRDAKTESSTHDFGRDLIPYCVDAAYVHASPFISDANGETGYWRDVGTLDAYWQANMELARPLPGINLYNEDWPLWTYQKQTAPAKFVFNDDDRRGYAVDSLVSGGCIVSGAKINKSILFTDVRVHSFADVSESVLLPKVEVGRHVVLNKVIVDANCSIPANMRIGLDHEVDRQRGFRITPGGVVVVTQDMLKRLI